MCVDLCVPVPQSVESGESTVSLFTHPVKRDSLTDHAERLPCTADRKQTAVPQNAATQMAGSTPSKTLPAAKPSCCEASCFHCPQSA